MKFDKTVDLYFKSENIKKLSALSFQASTVWLVIIGYHLRYENITMQFLLNHTPYLCETLVECIEEMMEKKYLFNKMLTQKSCVSYNKRTSE